MTLQYRRVVLYISGVFGSSLILWMALFSNISVYGQLSVNSSQNNDDKNLFITMLNLERIRNQIILTEKDRPIYRNKTNLR